MIEIKNLHKSFKQTEVIKGINLTIENGNIVSLIGPSGCGKTTTLRMINGLTQPTSGDILIDGKSVLKSDLIELRRNMGYVIQQTGLFPHMTIEENIEIIPTLSKIDKDKIKEKTRELMEMVNLPPDDYLWRYPSQLSGGQLQRIGVARAFAMNPDIILMDEPFSALDPITREQLQDEVLAIQDKFHKTVVFVTHDMNEAIKLSDKICIMNQGQVLQYDTPENILKNPANEFVEGFVGSSRIWDNPEYIKAKDIMLTNPVKTYEGTTVIKDMDLMRQKKVDSIFVVTSDGTLKGIVPAKYIQNANDRSAPIKNYVYKPKVCVDINENIIELLKKSNENKDSRMPVVDEQGKLVGLITKSSLVTTLSAQFIDSEEVEDND